MPLTAGAFATETTGIGCPADIEITKTADALSKVGDSVTYTFKICNVGDIAVNRGTVTDPLLGDLTAFFPATLAVDECVEVERTRTVAAGDPDPLMNTVTATYTQRRGLGHGDGQCQHEPVPARCRCHQDCTPDPVLVGEVVTCTIVVTDTSSDDAPALVNGTIVDSLTGNLLAAGEHRGRLQRLHRGPGGPVPDLHDRHRAHGAGHRPRPARATR